MIIGMPQRKIINYFRYHNVAVEGAKRTGKGLFVSYIIRKRKQPHYSPLTVWYSGTGKYDTIVKPINFFTVYPNTFEQFMTNKVITIPKVFEENYDTYIDEANTILPSSEYKFLDKEFKGLAQYQAYSGHLHNGNVHLIGQCYEKIYDKFRIHCDVFFRTLHTWHFKRLFITKMMFYDREQSFNEHKLPYPSALLDSKESKALYKQYIATFGTIKSFYLIQIIPKNNYDTRIMHEVIYGEKAPKSKSKKK